MANSKFKDMSTEELLKERDDSLKRCEELDAEILMRESVNTIGVLTDVLQSEKSLLRELNKLTKKQLDKYFKGVTAAMYSELEKTKIDMAKVREQNAQRSAKRRAKQSEQRDADDIQNESESVTEGENSDGQSVTEVEQTDVQPVREVSEEELQKAFPDGDTRYDSITHRAY